jgi:hypothetical protein
MTHPIVPMAPIAWASGVSKGRGMGMSEVKAEKSCRSNLESSDEGSE